MDSQTQTDHIKCLTCFAYVCMCWEVIRCSQNTNSKRIDNGMCKGPFVFISDRGQNMLKHCDILLYTLEKKHTDSTYSYQVTMKAFGDIDV